MRRLYELIDEKREKSIESLRRFLRMKSIAAQDIGMEVTARFLMAHMTDLGLKTRLLELPGAYPSVFGEYENPSAKKSLLIYGHYDVQPPEPLSLWDYPPFSAEIVNGKIIARGATDDKGNLWATIRAFEAALETFRSIPINIKFLFEGEEEIGSPNLTRYLRQYRDLLKADYTILCDRGIHESGRPQMFLGNKGIVSAEISVKGAVRDVHSGQAPFIPNAAWRLVYLLAQLKNETGRILIPGYYDNVLDPSAEEWDLLKKIPFDGKEYEREYGIRKILCRADGPSALKELLYSPTLTINGLDSGYQGKGNKTVIPSEASAKLDLRFVADQDPDACAGMLESHILGMDDGITVVNLEVGDAKDPHKLSPGEPVVSTAARCAKEVYKEESVIWPLLDGSGPMADFGKILGAPAMIIGLGAPFAFANTHAPNEYIGIDEYIKGIKLMASIYMSYGKDS